MRILIINGPNLNLLGKREQEVYGSRTFDDYLQELRTRFPLHEIVYFQSNVEGELINAIHEHGFTVDGIVINAGAYTHTSVAIADALKAVSAPYIEVHISNVYAREEYRHTSYLSAAARGIIIGFGLEVYTMAVNYWVHQNTP